MSVVFQSFIILITLILALSEPCPPSDLVSPCQCKVKTSGNEIHCHNTPMAQVQKTLTAISGRVKDKHFPFLNVTFPKNNYKSDVIPANFTAALTFARIEIQIRDEFDCNFTLPPMRVHESAFFGTKNRLEGLLLACFNLSIGPKPYNIFDSINSLSNIKQLHLAGVSKIPARAFKPLNQLNQLEIFGPDEPYLYPIDNISQSVGDDAFYQLDKLKQLLLGIDYLPAKALRMKPSTTQLNFGVGSDSMNGSSFAVGSLVEFNRPTTVWLQAWDVEFLNERVFRPFLDKDSKNRLNLLHGVGLNCSDCRNAWLAKQQDKFKIKVEHAYCDGNRNASTVFDKKFQHCK